jgi:hypothetical protein
VCSQKSISGRSGVLRPWASPRQNMSTSLIETLRQRQATGGDPALIADLQTAVVSRRNERGEHREWALLCEQAGLLSLAFSEFQLGLWERPAHSDDDANRKPQRRKINGSVNSPIALTQRKGKHRKQHEQHALDPDPNPESSQEQQVGALFAC